jgi:hypothetical protein
MGQKYEHHCGKEGQWTDDKYASIFGFGLLDIILARKLVSVGYIRAVVNHFWWSFLLFIHFILLILHLVQVDFSASRIPTAAT